MGLPVPDPTADQVNALVPLTSLTDGSWFDAATNARPSALATLNGRTPDS